MARHMCIDSISGVTKRRFMWAAGIMALLTTLTPVMAGPVDSARAGLADAYSAHLRATKGIGDIRTVHQSGAGSNGIEVVVVSAGFKETEKEEFLRLSGQFAQSLLSMQPWTRYRNVVNVHSVFVADESVAATRLQVGGYDGHVLGCDDGIAVEYSRQAANSAATIVMHNSAYSIAANGTWGVDVVNKTAARDPGAPVHELGHGMAGLGDEYIQREGPFDEPPESLQDTVNVTAEPNARLCKWHYWTEETWPGLFKPLKRPEGRVIANFEGAGWPKKIYRPEEHCMMRGDRDCFCVVCNETMEANFFRYMNLFKICEPAQDDIVLWKGESVEFRISTIDLLREPPEWLASRLDLYMDGKRIASSDRGEVKFSLKSKAATRGVHQLGANLNVENDFIRRDFGFLSRSRAWRVKVMPCEKPAIAVKPLVSVNADGAIEVPVKIKHANPSLFELKMAHAPSNAVLENGLFKWKPAGLTGSWWVDFTALLEQQAAVTESMEIRVTGADSAKVTVEAVAPEAVDAVTGEPAATQLKASATGGGHVLFEAVEIPAGAELDRYTGELSWTPLMSQAGPQLMRFRVRSGLAAVEKDVLFRVRRVAKPAPVSFCNTYIPDTLEYLKTLQQRPQVYQRLFETLRLLRDRYAAVYDPALVEAEKMYQELPPELRDNCIGELSLRAWAFTDKPRVLKWMMLIAEAGKTDEARSLVKKLDLIAELGSLRKIETTGGPAELAPLMEKLVKTTDVAVRGAIERAVASVCERSKDKAVCLQTISEAIAKAKGSERAALVPLLAFVRTPAAQAALIVAGNDPDKDVAVKALRTIETTGGFDQLSPLVAMMAKASDKPMRSAIERAAEAVSRRVADKKACQQIILPVLAKAVGPSRAALVRLLPRVQTPAAMEAWTAASADKDKEVALAARQSLDYLKGIGATDAYIGSWMVSGPYVGVDGGVPFDDVFAPEKADGQAKWQPCEAKDEKGALVVRLGTLFSGDYRAAYMKTVIRSDKEQEVLFEIGSDDGIKAWLNDKLIYANNADRPLKPAQDTFKGTLKAGDNVLLCKIIQRIGEWGGCVRIRSAEGGDALGVSEGGVSR